MIKRFSQGEFDAEKDYPLTIQLVRAEMSRRKLPASRFGPSSQFGGTTWTEDDLQELAAEWICHIRGKRAVRLALLSGGDSHIANAARRTVYHVALNQQKADANKDLADSLREALPNFTSLVSGRRSAERLVPLDSFPWQTNQRSDRQRYVSVPEVRAALRIIVNLRSDGWTVKSLLDCLTAWIGLSESGNQDFFDPKDEKFESAESIQIGRETASSLLSQLEPTEAEILRKYIIPNGLGEIGIEEAAKRLGMKRSTLHDRAKRLSEKLATLDYADVTVLATEARQVFLQTILDPESGKTVSE